MASDRRKSARQPYSEQADFEAMTAGTKKVKVARHRAHCLDISQGGIGITSGFKLREGEVLKLSIPFKEQVTLPVFAEVMWMTPEADTFRAGMRFLS
jgi:hypothetical protein